MRNMGLIKCLSETKKADSLSQDQLKALQIKRFNDLVSYVKTNSPYFNELYKDIPENSPIESYPTTNKQVMMANFDSWMTDRNITLERVKEFMSNKDNIGRLMDKKYLVYTTSGSTGNPCIVLYDKTAFNVSSAIGVLRSFARKDDLKHFMKHGGRTMALYADNGFYLGCGAIKYNLRRMPWKKKKMATCDVRKPTSEIVEELNNFQPSMLGSYPTALELIAKEQETGSLNIHPSIIMTGGENLTDDIRNHLSKTFDCYVQTNYSCTEGGTMACECTKHNFHINTDWVILEAVDEDNKPVPFGTRGAKLLLTNLANKSCPFIRFEITDRVTIFNDTCECGKEGLYLTLEGRTDDILKFSNDVCIPPLSLYAILKEVEGINRFQLIQHENDNLELRISCYDKADCFTRASKEVLDFLKENGVNATMFLSNKEPEVSPTSGKFKHIIGLKK